MSTPHAFLRTVLAVSLSGATCTTLPAQTELDSLWSVWQDPAERDTNRLKAMDAYIIAGYLGSAPDSALLLARMQFTFADDNGQPDFAARASYFMALSRYHVGDVPGALTYFEQSLSFYRKAGSEKDQASMLNNMAMMHQLQGAPDTALMLYEESLAIKRRIKDERGVCSSLNNMGAIHMDRGAYRQALTCFETSLAQGRTIQDSVIMASCLNNIGIILKEFGDGEKAMVSFLESLRIEEARGNTQGTMEPLNNIGELYLAQEDVQQALMYFERALAVSDSLMDRRQISLALNNIAVVHGYRGDAEKALDMYRKNLTVQSELNDRSGIALTLNNIGRVLRDIGKHGEALSCFQEALAISTELNDHKGAALAWTNMARQHLKAGAAAQALRCGRRALELGRETGSLSDIREASNVLWEINKALGHYRESLAMYELFTATRDSILSEENQREVIRQEYKYTYEKEALADSLQHAAELTQVENERTIERLRANRNRNRAFAVGGGALLLLAGGGGWFYTDRRRRRERFEKEAATLETQALRSQMNPHFIFNALNSINAFVQQNDPDNATSFLTKFARVMRSVLENSRHSEVPLQDDLDTLRGYMDLERKRMGGAFDFTIEVDPAIDPEEVMVPPLVVQPFVENAIWHGMKGRQDKGHITLRVKQEGEQLVWQIEDDGVGRQAKQEPAPETIPGQPVKKTSLGTAITRSRLDLVQKQHGGKAGFRYEDLEQGTRVIVEMPLLMG